MHASSERPAADTILSVACGQVRGGNDPVAAHVELPGLRGVLYSRPCDGHVGGDVHYASVCGSGLLARLCLADVAGHGTSVSAVAREMLAHLRNSVNTVDERRVLEGLDRRLEHAGLDVLTTAVLVTYYPPSRRLTVSYAGHPAGWLWSSERGVWHRLEMPPSPPRDTRFVDLPLGTGLGPTFSRHRFRLREGDRIVLVTDGVIEAPSPEGAMFGEDGLMHALVSGPRDVEGLGNHLLAALRAHAEVSSLEHDDVTWFVGEIVPGPPGPAVWHVIKNRLLRRLVDPG